MQIPAAQSGDIRIDDPDHSVQPLSLADIAYRRIEAMILSGKLQAGQRLKDTMQADAFSISRGPVRSALARLAEAGLVDLIPYRGAFVRTIDFDDVLEIYDVRAAVERAGTIAACRRMTPAALAELGRHRSEEHTSELQSLMRISYAVFCL